MKIIALNGSPRKGWNPDCLLLSWVDGVKSVCNDADIEVVNLYDLTFTGCRSCFACKLKDGKFLFYTENQIVRLFTMSVTLS
jgi:multimeric flavodoxin WrbA